MSYQKIILKWTAAVVAALLLILILVMVSVLGFSALGRYNSRQDTKNRVTNSKTEIQNQAQLIEVTKNKAEIRKQEAIGIKEAQDQISSTLTPFYLQWEAIQAEQAVATSGKNNTIVYVPSGPMGVPMVNDVSPANVGAGVKP